jgi:hypothetical protein
MTRRKLILVFAIHFSAMFLCFKCPAASGKVKRNGEKLVAPLVTANNQEDKKVLVMKPRRDEKTLLCTDEKVQKVRITFGRITTLNFPVAPKEVLPGEAVFDFKQIRNDLNIKSLRPNARTNVAVYLQERRCSLDLITVPIGGDDILFVRDPAEKQFEVRFQ